MNKNQNIRCSPTLCHLTSSKGHSAASERTRRGGGCEDEEFYTQMRQLMAVVVAVVMLVVTYGPGDVIRIRGSTRALHGKTKVGAME